MLILESIKEIRAYRSSLSSKEELGLVPTMGALHQGHLSLLQESQKQTDKTLVSIFVNPLQFNNTGDLNKYPVKTHEDLVLLKTAGCDAVFIPSAEEIYAEKPILSFEFGSLSEHMEGLFRPGHFNGVGIVVSKLLNLAKPHKAFFGEKDLQQLRIIQCLVRDLSMDVDIIPCATLRESDGLAMSSRNMRLNTEQRKRALTLIHYLKEAKNLLGSMPHQDIERHLHQLAEQQKLIRLEYISIVQQETLNPCTNPFQKSDVAICMAAFVDEIRLIDNIIVSS